MNKKNENVNKNTEKDVKRMVVSDEQKKDKERKVNSMKKEKVVEKKEEGQVRKSSHIKAIQNKEPSKGINEILFKQSPKYITLCEKKRLIKRTA